MHDVCLGQGLRKGGKNAVLQDINIPALTVYVRCALTTIVVRLSNILNSKTKVKLWDTAEYSLTSKSKYK